MLTRTLQPPQAKCPSCRGMSRHSLSNEPTDSETKPETAMCNVECSVILQADLETENHGVFCILAAELHVEVQPVNDFIAAHLVL